MNNHKMLHAGARLINLIIVGVLLFSLVGGALAAPPLPGAPNEDSGVTTFPISPEIGSQQPPIPGSLSVEVEEARARKAMEDVLAKFVNSLGSHYTIAVTEVRVEDEWGYGVAKLLTEDRVSGGPIHVLAHRLPTYSWQALVPSTDGLFLAWLHDLPESLLSEETKGSIRALTVAEPSIFNPSPLMPTATPIPTDPGPNAVSPESNHSVLTLPGFVLPYSATENGSIRWTGGPHAYGLSDRLAKFASGEGSGLDFAKTGGGSFDVLAMATGTIEQASCDGSLGLGCSVAIRHFTGNSVMVYGHLGQIAVQVNDTVSRGDVIGRAGSSGTDNVHLHIELRDGSTTCYRRCLPNNRFGNPIGWDDLVELVDGYRIAGYIADPDGIESYNYDGSAVKGDVKVIYDFRYLDCNSSGSCTYPRTNVIARVHSTFQCTHPTDCEINSPSGASQGTQFAGNGVFTSLATSGTQGPDLSPSEAGGFLLSSNLPPPPSNDTTPPSASSFTAQASGGFALLRTSGVQDNPGGSGVREVRFSAKWSGIWRGIGVDTTSPYSLDWDMCNSDVPNGDVELGMEVWDNAGNRWVWSEHYANPHITKDYNCAPPPPAEGVYLYRNTGQGGGSCYFTQDAPSIGNYCQSAGYGSGWNDDAESVRVQGPYYFALYRDDNYSGGEPLTGNPTGDLPTEWRNQASSIRIRRNNPANFTLYDLGDYNGQSFASDRTIYDLGHWAFNDRAESIRVATGQEVIVCADADFHGICGRTTAPAVSDINAVAQGLRNAVSSVRVCAGSCPPAPDAPYLHSPLDGSIVPANQSVLFQWSGNGDQYIVEWWGGALGTTQSSGWRSGTQWNVGLLPVSNNLYYWHVKAWNQYGEGGWSSTKSFYVKHPIPDLHPYAPPGYQSPAVPSSVRGTYSSNTLYAGQPTFFDWHFTNTGTGDAIGSFYFELWVDGTRYSRYPHSNFGRFQLGGFDDWQETITATGWHTVRIIVDPDNTIAESDETNNVWEGQFYWSPINGWWGEYYNNQTLSGYPVLVRDDPELNFEWYSDAPHPSVPADHFSARWTRNVYFEAGTYQFRVLRDDGARLWIDNDLVLDAWQDGRDEHFFDYTLQTGHHLVRLEMYENDGWARSALSWQASYCNDNSEPNGSAALATTISYGQSINGTICPSGDEDFFVFTGIVGDKVVIDIDAQSQGSALDSYVFILDSDGSTVVAQNDDERPGLLDSKLGYHLPHDGTFYVKVRAYGHPNVGGSEHFYTVNVYTDEADPLTTDITSPTNDAWLEPTAQTITGTAEDAGSGVQRVEFLWHDADWSNPDWVWLGADTNPTNGWNWIFNTAGESEQRGGAFYIWSFDWVGNWQGAAVWNLGIDRTQPTPSIVTAPVYGNAPFRDFWVDWSASTDNLSGIDAYDVQYRDNGGIWIDFRINTTLLIDRFVGEVDHAYDFRVRARDAAGNQSGFFTTAAPHVVQICPITPDSYEPDNSPTTAK
jgi:murein DD-endopeptidase MepM/ murein hydrolase activator NlpD